MSDANPHTANGETQPIDPAPEPTMCDTCIHIPYCACRGKTGYCGNYLHMATRVIGRHYACAGSKPDIAAKG